MAGNAMTGYRKFTRGMRGATVLASVLGAMAVGGCVSYTNVPVPESAPAYASANHWQSIKVTRTALDEVVHRFPAKGLDGRYAINFPAGTSRETGFRIIEGLPEGAILPYEGMGEDIPVYHISRIWIRASDAKVDVLYPITDIRGNRLQGTVTVWLYGGISNWRADRLQSWAPGTIPTPPIYVPLPAETLEAMKQEAKAQARAQERGQEQEQSPDDTQPGADDTAPEVHEAPEVSEKPYQQVPTDED